jgi:predicted anti-sigma-YlaC factor YlaD
MRCHDYEKWISDSLDGVLGKDQMALLDIHLTECAACRAYAKSLSRIQQEAGRLRKAQVAATYWEELSSTIRRRLEASEQGRSLGRPVRWNWRWAWGAAVLFLVVVGALLLRPNPAPSFGPEAFTFEACLGRLAQEIGEDDELAGNFNLILLNALRKDLSSAVPEENPVYSEDALFWEGLSEEEWKFLEEEIDGELKS